MWACSHHILICIWQYTTPNWVCVRARVCVLWPAGPDFDLWPSLQVWTWIRGLISYLSLYTPLHMSIKALAARTQTPTHTCTHINVHKTHIFKSMHTQTRYTQTLFQKEIFKNCCNTIACECRAMHTHTSYPVCTAASRWAEHAEGVALWAGWSAAL